jgi:hypothetical protein
MLLGIELLTAADRRHERRVAYLNKIRVIDRFRVAGSRRRAS